MPSHLLSERLKELANKTYKDESLFATRSFTGLSEEVEKNYKSFGYQFYRGKVRELIIGQNNMVMVHSDRLTAFDCLIDHVPYKGVVLTNLSEFWFTWCKDNFKNHFLKRLDDRALLVRKAKPIKAEVIIRGYLAGSMLRAYERGERKFCGQTLPDGLKAFQALPKPIITPTTKAAAFEHDVNATPEELIQLGVCQEKDWHTIEKTALRLFNEASAYLHSRGWMLCDTKIEFGKDADGEIILIDEILTPDSSRFWRVKDYENAIEHGLVPASVDKEILRRYLIEQKFSGTGPVPVVPMRVLVTMMNSYLEFTEDLLGRPLTISDQKSSSYSDLLK